MIVRRPTKQLPFDDTVNPSTAGQGEKKPRSWKSIDATSGSSHYYSINPSSTLPLNFRRRRRTTCPHRLGRQDLYLRSMRTRRLTAYIYVSWCTSMYGMACVHIVVSGNLCICVYKVHLVIIFLLIFFHPQNFSRMHQRWRTRFASYWNVTESYNYFKDSKKNSLYKHILYGDDESIQLMLKGSCDVESKNITENIFGSKQEI